MPAYMTMHNHPLWDDLLALRTESLDRLTLVVSLAGLAVLLPGLQNASLVQWRLAAVSVALFAAVGLARWLLERSGVLALAALALGVNVAAGVAVVSYAWAAPFFALPLFVFLAALSVDRVGTLVLAFGSDIFLESIVRFFPVPVSEIDLILLFALISCSGVLAWFFYHPIEIILDWAWESYLREQEQTARARDRQAELARTTKSLAEACERLEEANATLTSARRAAEEERRIKDEFATMVSHELRTPLNLVIGFSEMVAREVHQTSGQMSPYFTMAIEAIHHNALHLSDLADDVLDLGRLDAHRLALCKDWAHLGPIARAAISAVDGLYRSAQLRLDLDLAPDLPPLFMDGARIRQVLINLLVNAVRYIDEGGVTVTARIVGHDVLVAVADTGVGIAAEDLPIVFSGFRQSGQASRRGGFGLGLTISKRFVEMHAGSMWVTSVPDQGTTFSFTLPISANVAASAVSPRLPLIDRLTNGLNSHTVLVLARDSEAAGYFQRYLDTYRVVSATTPDDVAKEARQRAFEAIIVADAAGDEALLGAARRFLPTVPTLRCGLRTFASLAPSLGAAAFLTKPVSQDDLREALRHLRIRPRRALVVDDAPGMTLLLRSMLRELQPRCQVHEAHDGKEALALTIGSDSKGGPSRIDLILLDLLLPDVDGRDLLAAWRSHPRWHDVPVVIVSAAVDDHDHHIVGEFLELRREGGLSIGELMAATRGILDRRSGPSSSATIAWSDVSIE